MRGVSKPGSSPSASALACGSGLAAFLIAQSASQLGFFSCEPDFRSGVDPTQPTWNQSSGWMTILEDAEYSAALGAPLGGRDAVLALVLISLLTVVVSLQKFLSTYLTAVELLYTVELGLTVQLYFVFLETDVTK